VGVHFEEAAVTDPRVPTAEYVVMLGTGGYGTPEYVSELLRAGMSCARRGLVFSLCRDFMTLAEFMDRCFAVTSRVTIRCDVWKPDYVAYLYPDE
jgi:hypothetical protein